MQELAKAFVPAADEVYRLETEKQPDAKFFRKAIEGTHLNGDDPSDSKQGIYLLAPSGKLLAAKNALDADSVVKLLERGLALYSRLKKDERLAKSLPERPARPEDDYPEDGLALQVFGRDLPREGRDTSLWNQDRVWFRASEAKSFLPERLSPGEKKDAPLLARRLATTGLLDFIRGETDRFEEKDLAEASLEVTVLKVEKKLVHLRLAGKTRAAKEGVWAVHGFEDREKPTKQKRSLALALEGTAVFDPEKGRFTDFDLVAVGTRAGGTQFNARGDDLGEAPIGFSITLAKPQDRIAPTWIQDYGWAREAKTKSWR